MNSEAHREDGALDARLAGLPQWQPPADFAARLAAAAARQSLRKVVEPPTTWRWLLQCFRRRLPLVAAAMLLAVVLASFPWLQDAQIVALSWVLAAASATCGVVLTIRLLRAP